MTEKQKKWSDEAVATLLSCVGDSDPVSASSVEKAAVVLGVSTRSISSKLRQLDREVVSLAAAKTSKFTEDQSNRLKDFVAENEGQLTYKEIAEHFDGGAFSPKQIQGKLLALELTGSVKPSEKVEAARVYTEEEEAKFISLVNKGSFIEDIAVALNKSIASVRGKALSLTRSGEIDKIPTQKESHAVNTVDPIIALGEKIVSMTVSQIAEAVDKTERGIKTLLTRRGIKVSDYDGKSKKEKAEAKSVAV